MGKQSFERLIRLEDEELGSEGIDDSGVEITRQDKDTCHVPMLQQSYLDNLNRSKHEKINATSVFHFTINGRHIQLNTEQLKYLSLVTLTFQNAALNLIMRAAKTQKEQFSTAVAVTIAEILKLLTCILLIWYHESSLCATWKSIKVNIIDNYIDTVKVAVPSLIYYVQNNLLYVSATHLDAATNQVIYQLKILTTAIFSVIMLNKKLSLFQWITLITLFSGVALIESIAVSKHEVSHVNDQNHTTTTLHAHHNPASNVSSRQGENPIIGFLAVLAASFLSGFAGVYFEKILKNTSHVSLWIRNIQLAVVAIPIGFMQVLVSDYNDKEFKGLLHGFTLLTWTCIIFQVQGGLLVAVVVKFANNILKGFATSMSIVISTVGSMFLFDFNLTPTFIFGTCLVIGSVLMYNK